MKRIYFLGLVALLSVFLASDLLSRASAQKTSPNTAATVKPTPTPTPVPPRPAPTIAEEDVIEKVETELVNLNVRVVDRNNRPINNLQEGDFKIFEDNVAQKIEFFSKS